MRYVKWFFVGKVGILLENTKIIHKMEERKELLRYLCDFSIDPSMCLRCTEKCSWKRDKTIDKKKIHVKISISHRKYICS